MRLRSLLLSAALAGAAPAAAAPLALGPAGYLQAPAVNLLVFSNWYDGLFADSKISGVEIIQAGERTASNGDVRLSATPGQWDPIGRFVRREVDQASGTITATLEYPDQGFRYRIRVHPQGEHAVLEVLLDRPLPAALAGKAGFNLEFLPAAYFHRGYQADARAGTFPIYPDGAMTPTPTRNPASGRSEGPGAEPQPIAQAQRFVLAPEEPTRRVGVASDGAPIMLYDGRNQTQNGWFVLRSLLPPGKTGAVLRWTLDVHSIPGWLRGPVIAHSQLGYPAAARKLATVELDAADGRDQPVRLLKVGGDGTLKAVLSGTPTRWGGYLRYRYVQFDFSRVREPGLYELSYAGTRTAPFRIGDDVYDDAWHPTNDVYFPVAMDHMRVNEAYRVWHGDSHRDDARQAPVAHEHLDLYAQGPTTDDRFKPGEHIPGLNVGGWFDAGDFDIRTQSQYQVVRSLVRSWERFGPTRDTVSVDERLRRVEMHVPDGTPDLIEQIRHGAIQLVAQFDAVGHALNGIVEPDIGEYTHLGDAGSKTDGLVYDPKLAFGEERNGRSGIPDDRWAFTTKSTALDYGAIAGLAAAARALRGHDDALAAKALGIAQRVWTEQRGHPPDLYEHANTTGGPLLNEEFAAAVELLLATRDRRYADRVTALWPQVAARFPPNAATALAALPAMPPGYRRMIEPAVRAYAAAMAEAARANPFGVPITTGGWAGDGAVERYGLDAFAMHEAFPGIVDGAATFRAVDYLTGHHPASDTSFVSGVGTLAKEVAYGNNRADFTSIAGGVVPGVLVIKPDYPENHEDWPFFWGENEYVIPEGSAWIELAQAAAALTRERAGGQEMAP